MSFSGQGGYFQENSDDDTRFSATLQPPQPRHAHAWANAYQPTTTRESGLAFGAVRFPSTTSVLWDRACAAPFRASLADDAPAVVVTAECARNLNDFVDESNDTRRFVGAVARVQGPEAGFNEMSAGGDGARRAVVFGGDVAVQSIGGRRLDVVVSTQNVGPEDNDDDLTLAATVSKRDTTLRIELACAAPATTYAFSQLRTPLAVLPTPLDAALRRSNGASLPRRPGAYDAAVRCGYVTLDEARRAVFLLDDDPLAEATPLVGVFCAGFVCADATRACRDGAVVAACAAFLRRSGTALVADQTCLVAVFCAPARNQPAAPTFFECRGAPDGGREILDFSCDLDVASLGATGEAPRAVVVAALKRRPALAPPPPVAPPAKAAPPSPLKDDDSATTTTLDESTVDTRLKRATGRIRELEARLAAYEGAPRPRRRRPTRAVSASSRPSSRPTRPRRRRGRRPSPRRRRRQKAAAPAPARAEAPPRTAPPEKPLPRQYAPTARRRLPSGPPPCGRRRRRQRPRRRRGPPRSPATTAAAAARRLPTRRPKDEMRGSAEDVADVISGAYDDAGTDDDEDVSFASVGVVRALRLPDASVGSVGPETTGGALEAAAYASMPLTEVNENFPKAGEGADLNAFPKIRVPPSECFVDPDSDDEIVAQYVETGAVDGADA